MTIKLISLVVLTALICLCLPGGSYASFTHSCQPVVIEASEVGDDGTPRTEIGRFVDTTGVVIIQDRKKILEYSGMGFSRLILTAVSAYATDAPDKKVKGFELEFFDRRKDGERLVDLYHLSYVDLAEALNLQKAIGYLVSRAAEWKGKKGVGTKRIHFQGSDSYEILFDQGDNDDETKQQFTAYGGTYDSPRVTFRKVEDLTKFGQSITEATDWLAKE